MSNQPHLFSPLTIRGITMRNRIAVSPMCQYSSIDGAATDWHFVHLGSRAVGGAGLVMVEATAVEARGRISPDDMGIWDDRHIEPLARISHFVKECGAVPAIQIAHAGRKAGTNAPWKGGKPLKPADGGWQPVAPSAIPFADEFPIPHALDENEIADITAAFVQAAKRSIAAGFEVIEIHSAHGYLLHSFLSPISNKRTDKYGGSFENRIRLLLEVSTAVRKSMPEDMPLFVRISATDWVEGGWDDSQASMLSKKLIDCGVDLIDCSTGGLVPHAQIPLKPGYQVPFAERIKKETGIMTGAVGMITDPAQADQIIRSEQADIVLLARHMLRDPYWAAHAADTLGQKIDYWPVQYGRAR